MIKFIVDNRSVIKSEIDLLAEYYEVFILNAYSDIIEFDEKDKFYKIIYLTRKNERIKYLVGKIEFSPIMIKISEKMNWNQNELAVDAKVLSVKDLINGNIVTLLGETYCYNNHSIPINKTVSFIKTNEIYHCDFINGDKVIKTAECYSIGRYFPKEHASDNLNIYSSKILKCKYGESTSQTFYKDCLDRFLNLEKINYDLIAYVPCKSNKPNRFSEICDENLVVLVKDYGETKGLNESEKMCIMNGCFDIDDKIDVNNKSILLVDDVITSGATLKIITKLLYSKNVKKVIWFTYGKNTHNEVLDKPVSFTCVGCKNNMNIRFNTKKGNWFLSCKNYKECSSNYFDYTFETLNFIYK